MNGFKNILIWLAAALAVVAFAVQFNSIRQLRSELAGLRSQLPGAALPAEPKSREIVGRSDAQAGQRLADLEKAVAELARAADHLKARGQLPLAANDIEEARARFSNPALSDRDRLRALELLRRNGTLSDDLALSAIGWVQTATNAALRRSLLQQLDGATNAALKGPLLAMATTEQNSNVREQIVENLQNFAKDPQVESALWNILKNDTDEDVRDEAEQALNRGPFTEGQITALKERALNSESSLNERLAALTGLGRSGADLGNIIASFAELAQNSANSDDKMKLFRAFDQLDDPAVKLPLVQGLQDPNPLVREEAVDALSDFRDDPAILQWLQYVAQNDADPQVKREAHQAMSND